MNMDIDFRKGFSERLKNIRKKKNLTQAEFAEQVGIARASITYYEREHPDQSRLPDVEILYRMCRATGISADYYLGLTKNERGYAADIASVSRFLELSPEAIEILREDPEYGRPPDFHVNLDALLRCNINSFKWFLETCFKYISIKQTHNYPKATTDNEDLMYFKKKVKELGYDIVPTSERCEYYLHSVVIPALQNLLEYAIIQPPDCDWLSNNLEEDES